MLAQQESGRGCKRVAGVSPPVVGSMKMNFLASLTLLGVTATRRPGCQTLTLLEKLMKLKWSPGRRSPRMVKRASLVWRTQKQQVRTCAGKHR